MKETLKLRKPLTINGKKVKELTYDADEITILEYKEANNRTMSFDMSLAESDYNLHLQIGFAAIIAVNPNIDIADLERMKGKDLYKVSIIGRNFITEALADFAKDSSDEPSETTPDASTRPSNSLNGKD